MWFIYSLATLMGWGIYQFLIKIAQTTKMEATVSTMFFYVFAALTMAIKIGWDYFYTGEKLHISHKGLLVTVAGGAAVAIGTLFLGYALRLAPGSKVFPIINLALIVSSVLSIIFFREAITWRIALGILFAVLSIVLIASR